MKYFTNSSFTVKSILLMTSCSKNPVVWTNNLHFEKQLTYQIPLSIRNKIRKVASCFIFKHEIQLPGQTLCSLTNTYKMQNLTMQSLRTRTNNEHFPHFLSSWSLLTKLIIVKTALVKWNGSWFSSSFSILNILSDNGISDN